MQSIRTFIIENKNNTFKIDQNKNGMYQAERINNFDDNDISVTTAKTICEILKWVEYQENL